jgi:hypothetical protein
LSALKNLSFLDTARLDEFFDHTTIRREYLDHMLFWNASDLERKLEAFKTYYNGCRLHQSLNSQTPEEAAGKDPPPLADPMHFVWQSHCQGLFQTPIAA